jgi:hypothetical protein
MNLEDLAARIQRFDVLARGLAKEVSLWKQSNDPLQHLERRAYLRAVQNALAGVEEARVILAKVCQRLDHRGES